MYKDYLNTPIEIIEKKFVRKWGIEKEEFIVIDTECGRISSPNYEDFRIIQHIVEKNQEVWKLHLGPNSKITDSSSVRIVWVEYKVLWVYPVQGRKNIHHIKSLIMKI